MTNEYKESSAFDSILADFLSQQPEPPQKVQKQPAPMPVNERIGFDEAIRRSESDLSDILNQYVPAEREKPRPNYDRIAFDEAIRRSEDDLSDILNQYVPVEREKPRPNYDRIAFDEAIRRSEDDLSDILNQYVPAEPAVPEQGSYSSDASTDTAPYADAASETPPEPKKIQQRSESRHSRSSEIEIDPRFNLGGRRSYDGFSYGGKKVDMGADESYTPHANTEYSPHQWTPDSIDLSEAEEEARKKGLFKAFGKSKKAELAEDDGRSDFAPETSSDASPVHTPPFALKFDAPSPPQKQPEYSGGFSDSGVFSANYAAPQDYEETSAKAKPGKRHRDEFDFDDDHVNAGGFPGSFKEYVSSLVTSFLYRLHRSNSGEISTCEDDDEYLGAELSPSEASKYYGNFANTLHLRFRISLVLLTVLCYISVGLPVPGALKSMTVAAAACMAVQFTIMLLSLDVVTAGIVNCFRGKCGAESLAVFSCLVTTADCLIIIYSDFGAPHMPLCVLSSLSLVGVTFATLLSARGLRKALRVPAIGKIRFSVAAESASPNDGVTLVKRGSEIKGYVRRSEESAPDETAYIKAAPFLILLSLLLTVIVALIKNDSSDFVYILSLFSAPMIPVCALLCFSLPFFVGSNRIFYSGAGIAGWSGLCEVGKSKNIIVTDSDLFPADAVEIARVRIFADGDTNKVISYAGTLICASDAACKPCFEELMEKNGCSVCSADNIEYLPGGGISALIDGHTVLCGSTDLMYLMNVRVPFRFVDKTTVMLAIDGTLYGIFNLNYKPLMQVRQALVSLMRSSLHPVFSIHDFNITPEMLHNCFDIATDGYDFPPYAERFSGKASENGSGSRIAAVVCREGLGSMTHLADTGHSMYVVTRINLVVTLAATVLGMLTVFIKLLTSGSVSIVFLLIFMLICAIPVFLCSFFMPVR